MKAGQLYYTSCEDGYEQSPGFQVKAVSKNFDENYISEFKTFGAYKPPYNFPTQPTQEEIKKFPISFRYKKKDKAFLFVKTTYTGKDFTAQRYGNYFLHGVLLNDLKTWPVDLYYTGIFKDNDTSKNIYLNEIEIKINKDEINTIYINALSLIDKNMLLKILRAFFLSKKDKRPLLIRVKNDKEALNYLLCFQKLFPLNIAKNISFSSYQFNYNYLCDINFTIGETDLNFDFDDFNYNFYIFDLVNKKYTKFSNKINYTYEKIIEFADDLEFLEEFYKFSSYFSINNFNDLDNIFKTYLFLNDYIEVSSAEIINLLDLVQIIKEPYKKWLIKEFLNFIKNMNNLESQYLSKLIDFYFVVYKQNKEPVYKNFLIKNLFILYLEFLKKHYSKEEYIFLYKKVILHLDLENEFKKYIEKNVQLILNDKNIIFDEDNIVQFFEYISMLKEEDKIKILDIILTRKCIKIPLKILKFFKNKNIVILLLINKCEENFILNFVKKLYFLDEKSYFSLVEFLSERNETGFLKLQFKDILLDITDKLKFFNFYIKNIQKDKEFFLKLFWETLSSHERINQILRWYKSRQLNEILKTPLKADIAKEINNNLSFNTNDELFDKLLDRFEDCEFEYEINNIFLKKVIFKFKEEDLEKLNQELKKLEQYNYDLYKEYLVQFYKNAIFSNVDEVLKKTFLNNIDNKSVLEVFNKIILEKNEITPLDKELILFWLKVDKNVFRYKHLQEKIIKNIIVKKIVKFDKEKINSLKEFLLSVDEDSKDIIEKTFEEIDEMLVPVHKKILNKVNSFFSKIAKKG